MIFSISIAVFAIVLILFATPKTLAISLLETDIPLEDVSPGFNNNTGDDTTSSSSGIEQMKLQAQLKPHENEFLADDGWYEIKKFGFVSSNGSEICPSDNCKYGVENGEFTPNTFSGGYTFEGKLKVTTEEGDVKKSKFYDFRVSLDKTGEEESAGETTQTLEGTFGLGGDSDITYDIINATLLVDDKNPVLTIQGERS